MLFGSFRERRIYCHSRFDLYLCSLDDLDHDAYIVIADSLFIYCNGRFLAAALKYKLNPRLCSLGHSENDACSLGHLEDEAYFVTRACVLWVI